MIEKIWFVHVKDHHKGPFSAQEIKYLRDTGRITEQTYVWKEGLENWLKLQEMPEFGDNFKTNKLNQDLPERLNNESNESNEKLIKYRGFYKKIKKLDKYRPSEVLQKSYEQLEKEKEQALGNPQEYIFNTREMSPLLDAKETEKLIQEKHFNQQELKNIVSNLSALDTDKESSVFKTRAFGKQEILQKGPEKKKNIKQKEVRSFSLPKIFRGVVFCSLMVWLGFVLYKNYKEANLPFNPTLTMDKNDYSRLLSVLDTDYSKALKMELAVDPDLSTIWVSSNYGHEIPLQIELISVQGRVLSTRQIQLKSEAVMKNHFASFKKIEFFQGSQFFPGVYTIVVKGRRRSGHQSAYSDQHFDLNYKTNMLIGVKSKKVFETRLSNFNKKVLEDQIKYLNDGEQKLSTYLNAFDSIENSFFKIFKALRDPQGITAFENLYQTALGILLTNLILDDEKIYTKISNQYEDLGLFYRESSKLGKQVGLFVTDLIEQIKNQKNINHFYIKNYSEKYQSHFRELREAFVIHGQKLAEKKKTIEEALEKFNHSN